jgi:glutaredoxin
MKLFRIILLVTAGFLLIFKLTNTLAATAATQLKTAQPAQKTVDVIFFSASWCNYCTKLREYLVVNKIAFTEYDIEKSVSGYREYKNLGGNGIPLIRVGDTVIHGFNKRTLEQALEAAGLKYN